MARRITKAERAALLARLAAREAATRKDAAREAGEQRIKATAPRLVELLRDRNAGVATTAAWALGRLRYVPAEQPLAALLRAPHEALARGAAQALGRLGTPGALDALLAALPDAGEAVARSIELALEHWPAEMVAPRLVAQLRHSGGPARARASRALLRRPAAAATAVLAALDDGTVGEGYEAEAVPFRRAAAYVLAESATPAALAALLELSRSADARTRLYATRGLGALAATAPEATARLRELRDDERRDVAMAARQALDNKEPTAPASVEVVGAVVPLDLPPGQTYLLTVLPGLEELAADELAELDGARVTRRLEGALLAILNGPPVALQRLRTVLDALLFAGSLPAAGAGAVFRDQRPPRRALAALKAALPAQPLTFYVHVPRDLPTDEVRRLRAAAGADLARAGGTVEPAGALLEAEVVMAGGDALLGLRVLDRPPGRRPLSSGGLPASLNATLAAALVRLTDPAPDDVFLDPLCGAGTILRERALAGPYARLLGGDADERAVALARANLDDLSDLALERWEATALPLADGSVHKAALNPPYGRRAGSHAANEALYPALIAELARVVRAGGLVALVTTEKRLTVSSLRAQSAFARVRELPVETGGLRATIYLLRRR